MKKKLAVTMVALLVLALSFAMAPKKANAIPAFAQKYHFSCAVCHTVFPNLNPFGRAFWRNGFRLPGTNGTPADATQITEGLSLPNPWPIPVMIEPIIQYQHTTNENVSASTDQFSIADVAIVSGGAFKVYTPLADSISFYVHLGMHGANSGLNSSGGTNNNNINVEQIKQAFASINGLGSGFGIAPHLFNLKLGAVTTASPYFYRQPPFYFPTGPVINGQGLAVGGDGEATVLIHSRNAGFALYGTPGYHLWYKVTVTNDAGGNNATASGGADAATNAMEYSYQLKEYAPIPMGQLEFGYYGATIAEPMGASGANWTNRIMVNGVDVDLANDVYELGLTYMVQSDSNPYANDGAPLPAGVTDTSNGYSTFEVYGRYILPVMNNGIMLSADYAQYSWTHKNSQLAYLNGSNSGVDNPLLYNTTITLPGTSYNGIKDALALQAEINLAYNAHLYLGYTITNQQEDNLLGTGLDFAF